jgi:hypothetical protein
MGRSWGTVLVVVGLSGCLSIDNGPETGGSCGGHYGRSYGPPTIPGLQGAYGEKVPVAAPYNMAPPPTAYQAKQMLANSVPMDMVQLNRGAGFGPGGPAGGSMPPTVMPAGGIISPVGVPFAPGAPGGMPMPPGMGGPGMMPPMPPGLGTPGAMPQLGLTPGSMPSGMNPMGAIMPASFNPGMPNPAMPGGFGPSMAAGPPPGMTPDLIQANYPPGAGFPASGGLRFPVQRTQVRFVRPSGMEVSWFTTGADGKPSYSNVPIHVPGRYNFLQGAVYRLKLSKIEGRPGLDVYPTLEVVPVNPKTEAFLSHSSVPVEFTNEDFKQIAEGNYVVKVIYLPDPQFQDVAGTGTDEILSTRLEPGADPINEALRRGSILLVIRMGNMHQELEHTPPINAGPQGAARPPIAIPGVMVPPPGAFMPYGPTPGVLVGPGDTLGSVPPSASPPAPAGNPKPATIDVRSPENPSVPPTSALPPVDPGNQPPATSGTSLPPVSDPKPEKSESTAPSAAEGAIPPVVEPGSVAPPPTSVPPVSEPDSANGKAPPANDVTGPRPPEGPRDSAPPPAASPAASSPPAASPPGPAADPAMPNLPPLPDPREPTVSPAPRPSVAPAGSNLPPTDSPRAPPVGSFLPDPDFSIPPTMFDAPRAPAGQSRVPPPVNPPPLQ